MPRDHCTICNAANARKCARCKSTAYCSPECQQSDWYAHRRLCRTFTNFLAPPGPNFRRAILFPTPLGSGPRLTWVTIIPNAPGWNGHDKPLLDDPLKLSPNESKSIGRGVDMIRGNALRAGPNDHVIELTYRDIDREMPPNQSIACVGGSRWRSWPGPFIAMAKTGSEFDPPYYQDLTLVDFRDVADYRSWYREGEGSAIDGVGSRTYFARTHVLPRETGKVKGVRVNARGDQVVCGLPLFQAVDVPRRHPLFYLEGDDPSSVTDHLSLPVRTLCAKKYTPDSAWKNMDALTHRFDNPVFDGLYLDLNPESSNWGQRPERWKGDVGSVLVVARDGKDLTVEEVEQIYHFSRDWLLPRVRQCADGEGSVASRRAVLHQFTPDTFREYSGIMDES